MKWSDFAGIESAPLAHITPTVNTAWLIQALKLLKNRSVSTSQSQPNTKAPTKE